MFFIFVVHQIIYKILKHFEKQPYYISYISGNCVYLLLPNQVQVYYVHDDDDDDDHDSDRADNVKCWLWETTIKNNNIEIKFIV